MGWSDRTEGHLTLLMVPYCTFLRSDNTLDSLDFSGTRIEEICPAQRC